MARRLRLVGSGYPHHIVKRGHNRQAICRSKRDFRKLRQLLLEGCSEYALRIHSYVIMGNHFHLLATPEREDSLSGAIKWVTGTYTQWLNVTYARTGTAWEGRYWASVVDSQEYFMLCITYIELNPVRAGIVSHPSRYPWSSYASNALGAGDPLVVPHESYLRLGTTPTERREVYGRLLQAGLDWDTEMFLREATRKADTISAQSFRSWQAKARRLAECAK